MLMKEAAPLNCRNNQQHPTQRHIHPPQWHFLVHLTVQSALSIMYSLLGNKRNLTNYRHNDRTCSSFFSVFLPVLSWRPLQWTDVKTGWQVTQGGQCEYIITAWEHLPFANCMKCIVANWATVAFVEFTGSSFMWWPLSLKWWVIGLLSSICFLYCIHRNYWEWVKLRKALQSGSYGSLNKAFPMRLNKLKLKGNKYISVQVWSKEMFSFIISLNESDIKNGLNLFSL